MLRETLPSLDSVLNLRGGKRVNLREEKRLNLRRKEEAEPTGERRGWTCG